jgi:probable HAF family extracellular repeat protein
MASKTFPSLCSKRLASFVALFLLWAGASSLQAYTPIYSVKTNIGLTTLSPSGEVSYATVTGLNNSNVVAGYVGYSARSHGVNGSFTNAFVWDDAAQSLTAVNSLVTASSSMATCDNDAGIVAGVCWTANGVAEQLGFVLQNGVATSFQSPAGGDIDTVVGVNAYGQVIATYYGGSGYIRAFLWDGTNSTDLGDLGDPAESFVWPQGINDNGQVIGTVYIFQNGRASTVAPSTAFLWQNGTLSAVDSADSFTYTIAQAINAAGESIGDYLNPSPVHRGQFVPGGYYGDNSVATDLTDLGGGGTFPYFIDSIGNVYGVSNAADGSLHLFEWQNGSLTDLGSATLTGDDTNFQMTSVNALEDIGGFVTDASGNTQPFLQTQQANYNLTALMPGSSGFSAANNNGSLLVVNNAELVAVAGTLQGQSVVLLLTQDADGNGLPDGWEVQYFGHTLGAGATALAPNGSGLTILQCYEQGINPLDYYNGHAPTFAIVSGNNQTGSPNGFVPAPLIVSVADGNGNPIVGAPVSFTVSQGGGQVQKSSTGTPAASITVLTAYNGQAKAFFKSPNVQNNTSTIATAPDNGTNPTAVTFTELSDGGSGTYNSPFDPTNVTATLNPDGSMDVTWTSNADPSDQTPISIQDFDANGNYHTIATAPAGATSFHIPAP